MRTYPTFRIGKNCYLFLFVTLVISFLFSCRKHPFEETNNPSQIQQGTNNTLTARSASEIREWLDDKKAEIGIDSNATIDKLLYSMDDGGAYTEAFKDEQFIIIPWMIPVALAGT